MRERTRGTVCAYRDGVGAGWDPGSRSHRGATQPATGLSLGLRRSKKVEYVGMYIHRVHLADILRSDNPRSLPV